VHQGLYGPDAHRSSTVWTEFAAICGQELHAILTSVAITRVEAVVSTRKIYRLVGPDGAEVLSSVPGALGGHRRTRVYGRLDCPVALSLIARGFDVRRHRVFFADERTAVAAGYRPCGACLRKEYLRWKATLG
jgi:hypothetical protein